MDVVDGRAGRTMSFHRAQLPGARLVGSLPWRGPLDLGTPEPPCDGIEPARCEHCGEMRELTPAAIIEREYEGGTERKRRVIADLCDACVEHAERSPE